MVEMFTVGQQVELHGMSTVSFNGRVGIIIEPMNSETRYGIKFPNGEKKLIKQVNIRLVTSRVIYVLAEYHIEHHLREEKIMRITEDPEFTDCKLFTEETKVTYENTHFGKRSYTPINKLPSEIEGIFQIFNYVALYRLGDTRTIPGSGATVSEQKTPLQCIVILMPHFTPHKVTEQDVIDNPPLIFQLLIDELLKKCHRFGGPSAEYIIENLPTLTYESLDENLPHLQIYKESYKMVDDAIVKNVLYEHERAPQTDVFIIRIGETHLPNVYTLLASSGKNFTIVPLLHREPYTGPSMKSSRSGRIGLKRRKHKSRRSTRKRRLHSNLREHLNTMIAKFLKR